MENPQREAGVCRSTTRRALRSIGVSLDRDQSAWTNAIRRDGLPWKHVSDLGYWNNAAAGGDARVSSIPFTVLVGRDGKVIAKNLRGEALEQSSRGVPVMRSVPWQATAQPGITGTPP